MDWVRWIDLTSSGGDSRERAAHLTAGGVWSSGCRGDERELALDSRTEVDEGWGMFHGQWCQLVEGWTKKLTHDCPEILILIMNVVLLKQRQVHSPIIKQLQLVVKYDFLSKKVASQIISNNSGSTSKSNHLGNTGQLTSPYQNKGGDIHNFDVQWSPLLLLMWPPGQKTIFKKEYIN